MLVPPSGASRPLWRCSKCSRRFANRHQSHSCGRYDLRHHFQEKPRAVRELYEAFVRRLRLCGPVTVLPEKTRIAFQVRMSFAQVTPKLAWLDGHVVLARRVEHPLIRRIDTLSSRNHVHHFRLTRLADLDADLHALLVEAYAVGEQRHLRRGAAPPRRPRRSPAARPHH
jgi:Domain of unknown function (DUF5655)